MNETDERGRTEMAIPEQIKSALDTWAQHGFPHPDDMGSFVRAVLTNDLRGAFLLADDTSRAALTEIIAYVIDHVPTAAVGRHEKLVMWHDYKRLDANSETAA